MKLTFIGDFAFPFGKDSLVKTESVKKVTKSDLVIGNLESSMISANKRRKPVNHYSTDFLVDFLSNQGIHIVSLANNHVLDYGKEGLKKLIKLLDENSIRYFGAGMNISEASKALEIKLNGNSWAFIAYGWPLIQSVPAGVNKPGVAPLERKLILEELDNLRKKDVKICVHLHWGYEFEKYPLPAHRKLAHDIIDSGADLVIGHHPHVIQGIEFYKERLIAYSLGNFYFQNSPYSKSNDIRYNDSLIGLVLKFNSSDPRNSSFYISKYNPENNSLKIKPLEGRLKAHLNYLSEPLYLKDREYVNFFRKNRRRKKMLPILTGRSSDKYKIIRVLNYKNLKKRLIESGKERVKNFPRIKNEIETLEMFLEVTA